MEARLEHVNVTVSDPDRSAALLQRLFGWRVRWSGPALGGGRTVHVGTDDQYLALYAGRDGKGERDAEGADSNRWNSHQSK